MRNPPDPAPEQTLHSEAGEVLWKLFQGLWGFTNLSGCNSRFEWIDLYRLMPTIGEDRVALPGQIDVFKRIFDALSDEQNIDL